MLDGDLMSLVLIFQELDHLTNSYQQLKQAQAKFKSCVNDVKELGPSSKGTYTHLPYLSDLAFDLFAL